MSESSTTMPSPEAVEEMLRGELAQGDVILATARPILRHLLANDEHALFNDEVIARLRGMMISLARQLLFALAEAARAEDREEFVRERQDALALELLEDTAFLGHAHALTIEAQLADRVHQRSGIDPVLSPLLQELAASPDEALAGAAMRVVAAQARFMQQQRRMELPLDELPAELFHAATRLLKNFRNELPEPSKEVRDRLRAGYSESERRIGQVTHLLVAMGNKAKRALSIDHAGLSIFATALSMASEQDRDVVLLSLSENQCARLALSLRAAGLGQDAVEEQFLYLHPDISLPDGFEALRADRAAALLSAVEANAAY